MLLPRVPSMMGLVFRKFTTSCRICGANASPSPSVVAKASVVEQTAKDIILFKYDSPRFFRMLNIFAIVQYGVWMYICASSFSMIDTPVKEELSKEEKEKQNFWEKINLGSSTYKYGLAIGSALMGVGILTASWTYMLRTVKYLILKKDGKTLSFVTYAPFAKNVIFDTPISKVSAFGSRTSGATQMPVKVKGRRLYFLIDVKDGKITHTQLFDKTVGTKRKL